MGGSAPSGGADMLAANRDITSDLGLFPSAPPGVVRSERKKSMPIPVLDGDGHPGWPTYRSSLSQAS
jgi:hypothetical protein